MIDPLNEHGRVDRSRAGSRGPFAAARMLLLGSVALLLMAAAPARQGAGLRIVDGEFVDSDWQLTTLSNHPDIRVRTLRRTSGGNPGAFRVIEHDLPADRPSIDSPQVMSLHRYLGFSYEASHSGAIESICYEEDAFVIRGFGQGQGAGVALWQDGRSYIAAVDNTNVPSSWRHLGPRVFQQDDFYEVLPGAIRDPSSHPDFSSTGGAIDLGFSRSNTSRTSGYVLVGAIDNWTVEIDCDRAATPSPTASPTSSSTASPTPSPTASPTPSPTASPTPSPTASATPSPTASPSPEPTASPRALYLPLLLRERCPPAELFADIALVLDASTTMLERSGSGARKIDLAIAATRSFLAGLRLRPGGDRVSLVAFNAEAEILAPLTDDGAALEQALGQIAIRPQSRIDLGLLAGARSLAPARPSALRALVLLSDGMANPVGSAAVLEAAASARAVGVTLYVVGLGPNMDDRILQAIAADPKRYFPAEEPALLGAVYAELARRVPCPPSAYWGQR